MRFCFVCGRTDVPRSVGQQESSFCRRSPEKDKESARRIFINTDWFCSGGTRADSAQLRRAEGRRMFAREHLFDSNPEGIVSSSPGLQGTSYPGKTSRIYDNPNGVVSVPRCRPATHCQFFKSIELPKPYHLPGTVPCRVMVNEPSARGRSEFVAIRKSARIAIGVDAMFV